MNVPAEEHLRIATDRLTEAFFGDSKASDGTEWVRQHLTGGCEICATARSFMTNMESDLLLAVEPQTPPASLRRDVLDAIGSLRASEDEPDESGSTAENVQIWNRWSSPGDKQRFAFAADDSWQPTAIPGITARMLHVDVENDSVTMLVQMEPGTAYPPHRHGGNEQCFVVEGALDVGEQRMHVGDYQFAPAGSTHVVQSTQEGCTLLLISSRSDEILD